MNSDNTYDQIENTQYVFGKNIRITKNQLIGEDQQDYSSLHEGAITPVFSGIPVDADYSGNIQGHVVASDTVDRIGVIVTKDDASTLYVYRFELNEETNQLKDFKLMWRGEGVVDVNTKQISVVLYKELENVIKLYIATGTKPIITLRVDDPTYKKYMDSGTSISVDDLINNRIIPQHTVRIENVIGGRLKTSQVQYTYRYYNKHGNTTQLAPLTNKIQVINQQKTKETGCAEDTETSMGFEISIDTTGFTGRYDRLQIYRLSYIKQNTDADIALIYDDKLDNTKTKFVFSDVGIEPLQSLTIEEFAAMSGLIIIPKVIETNQQYMFAANVEDNTIITDFSITPKGSIEGAQAKVLLANTKESPLPVQSVNLYKDCDATLNNISWNGGSTTVSEYLDKRNINSNLLGSATYNDNITSSLLRSLRRGGETYKYGIVFYDEFGRRTDVQSIGDYVTPEYTENNGMPFTLTEDGKLIANPLGVKINIPTINYNDEAKLVGFQIVRRSSNEIYQKTLLQAALARPIAQWVYETQIDNWDDLDSVERKLSPFYPLGYLTVANTRVYPGFYEHAFDKSNNPTYQDRFEDMPNYPTGKDTFTATTKNDRLYQVFSSEIDFRRDDVLHRLSVSEVQMKGLYFLLRDPNEKHVEYTNPINSIYWTNIDRINYKPIQSSQKIADNELFTYYQYYPYTIDPVKIKAIKDVKIPNWNDGFTEIYEGDNGWVAGGIKKYQSYVTNIDKYQYNNWCSFGRYDLRIGQDDQNNQSDHNFALEFINTYDNWSSYYNTYLIANYDGDIMPSVTRYGNMYRRLGIIGPGPSCLLAVAEGNDDDVFDYHKDATLNRKSLFYTEICNFTHPTPQADSESAEQIQYYGFGNYFSFDKERYTVNGKDYVIVFDGDIYITPHELTTMYKTYHFQSKDTLPSTQIVNYVPLESKVNTYFDYGMNYLNTSSANLLYEPGSIDGVATQERPVHQYNMIYSDNDASNDVFTLVVTDKNDTNTFKQRTYFSEPKENGEYIDNFLIFKPASFIDVDSKYGQITNLLTDKNTLYYWQDHAFGKFSVNERSLVNDTNGNTIMLGQAGILSRYDYINTKYGMRLEDFCARAAEQGVYWVDVNNKAIVAGNNSDAVNYGERLNVQNIINCRIQDYIPKVDYDLQNNELLCKCFNDGEQMIFNLKFNIPTSIYNRQYDDIVYIKNHLYGITVNDGKLTINKYNYLKETEGYLTPIMISMIVNPSGSITKVFDNQQIIPIKKDEYKNSDLFMQDVKMSFETDIVKREQKNVELYTDREGNILYAIPRHNDELGYGSRIRGKWLKVDIEKENPDQYFTISHVITKFRQSFS